MSTCSVCGKETEVFVCGSMCGGQSFAYCKECLEAEAEPWGTLVDYISIAGRYPDDINESFQHIVRQTCKRLGKTEDEFANAVNEILDNEDLTICGEHGCDGCFLRYSGDIEACKQEAERKEENRRVQHK